MSQGMTLKEARFYGEYIKDQNGTRAARAIGVPAASAHVAASRMLAKPAVKAAIDAWTSRQQAKLEITAEVVLNELRKLATFDAGNLYYEDGTRIPVHLLDDTTRAAVAAVTDETTESVTESGTKKTRRQQFVKMADKGQNLERLGRYFGLFKDKLEVEGKLTLEQLVCGSSSAGDSANR